MFYVPEYNEHYYGDDYYGQLQDQSNDDTSDDDTSGYDTPDEYTNFEFHDGVAYQLTIYDHNRIIYRIRDEMNTEQAKGASLAATLYLSQANDGGRYRIELEHDGEISVIDVDIFPYASYFSFIVTLSDNRDQSGIHNNLKEPGYTFFWVMDDNQTGYYLVKTRSPIEFLQGFKTVFRDLEFNYRSYIVSPIWYCDENLELQEQIIV